MAQGTRSGPTKPSTRAHIVDIIFNVLRTLCANRAYCVRQYALPLAAHPSFSNHTLLQRVGVIATNAARTLCEVPEIVFIVCTSIGLTGVT